MKKILMLFIGGMILTFSFQSARAQEEFASTTIQVGVIVSDLEKSMEFYTEVVGMQKTGQFDVDKTFAKKSGLSNGIPFQVKVLKLGTGENATQFKLMSFGGKAVKQNNEFIYNHTGMQYITIYVKDLSPVIKRVKQHDVEPRGATPVKLNEQSHFLLLRDPDGTFIELIGPWKDR